MEETVKISEPQSLWKKILIDFVDIIAFLIFIIGLFFALKVFVIAPVIVKGHSMLPNYNPGEYIFVDKFYYKLSDGINRGDVVVVMPETANISFLKRIVGLPGDTITISSGNVYLCKTQDQRTKYSGDDVYTGSSYSTGSEVCKEIKEPYIKGKTVDLKGFPEKIETTAICGIEKFVLGSGEYLVFGDDRMYSTDSRCCFVGFCPKKGSRYYIKKDEILGRVRGFKI